MRATAALLADLGHDVSPVPTPFTSQVLEDFLFYWSLLAAAVERLVAGMPGGDPARLEPWTRSLAAEFRGAWHRAPGCVWRLRRFAGVYADRFSDLDVLVGPTTGAPAPQLGVLSPSQALAVKRPQVERLVPFTPIQNISGAPAISLPLGRSGAGLPIGVQLAGRLGEDARLLGVAAALEAALPVASLRVDAFAVLRPGAHGRVRDAAPVVVRGARGRRARGRLRWCRRGWRGRRRHRRGLRVRAARAC